MPRGKRDRNEREIIQALEAAGCGVIQLEDRDNEGIPDLLVSGPQSIVGWSQTLLMEVKMPGQDAEPHQAAWHARWPGRVVVVHTAQEAFRALGVIVAQIPREARNVAQTGGRRRVTIPGRSL